MYYNLLSLMELLVACSLRILMHVESMCESNSLNPLPQMYSPFICLRCRGNLFYCFVSNNNFDLLYFLLPSQSTWRDAPASGTKLATFSTRYFLLLAMIIAAIASAYNFAYFRYDNLCVSPQQFAQNHTNLDVTLSNGDIEVINVTSGLFVRVCNEDTCCQEQNVWQKAGFNNPMDISPTNQRKSEFRWLSEPISAQDPAYSYAYVLSTFIILITYLAHQSFRKVKKYFNALYREIYEVSHIQFATV